MVSGRAFSVACEGKEEESGMQEEKGLVSRTRRWWELSRTQSAWCHPSRLREPRLDLDWTRVRQDWPVAARGYLYVWMRMELGASR